MKKRGALVIQEDSNTTKDLVDKLNNCDLFENVWLCHNGFDGSKLIASERPDVVIFDLVLPGLDGYALLRKHRIDAKAKFIALSAIGGDQNVRKAVALGADYFMVKPMDFEHLIHVIDDLINPTETIAKYAKSRAKTIEERISNIFISVGIPAHIKGYQYLREGIRLAIENPPIINNITKGLYPQIAVKYETSPSKVERAIRHAIEVAWSRGKIENINSLFGVKVYTNNEKPTNGEFIALLADKMILEGA